MVYDCIYSSQSSTVNTCNNWVQCLVNIKHLYKKILTELDDWEWDDLYNISVELNTLG